jgi:hypothetical protein
MIVDLQLPAARADLLARLHRDGTVREVHYDGDWIRVTATVPTRSLEVFAAFLAVPVCDPRDDVVSGPLDLSMTSPG